MNQDPAAPPHPKVVATQHRLREMFGSRAFPVADAEALGLSCDRVERACAAGLVTRVGRGWYVVTPDDAVGGRGRPGLDAIAHGRLLATGESTSTVLCRTSAAAVWGLPLPPGVDREPGLEVLANDPEAPWGGRRSYETVWRWRVREEFIVQGPHGGRVTDPLQTALDLGRGLDVPLALIALDAALRLLLTGGMPADVARAVLRERAMAARGRPGMRGPILAARHADGRAESPLESIVRGRILEAGLPRPVPQARVIGASGRSYRADLGMALAGDPPGVTRLLVEADGMGKYTCPGDLAAEKRRQHDLEGGGYRFVRVVYDEALRSPEPFLMTIRRMVGGC